LRQLPLTHSLPTSTPPLSPPPNPTQADLFGDIAEAKEVDAFAAGYKEAKRCRANDTFLLLASSVTFASHLPALLAPVRARLGLASHPKTRNKLAALLQAASRGVLANPTASPRDICEFVFAVADTGLAAEEATRAAATAAAEAALAIAGGGGAAPAAADPAALHQHLLVEFALTTLQSALKKGAVAPRAPANAPLLSPLLPLLVRALRSRHAPTAAAGLQAMCLLLPAALEGMEAAATEAGKVRHFCILVIFVGCGLFLRRAPAPAALASLLPALFPFAL
jgi:U3 small nucleolar RNA-associated protein 20